MLEGGNASAFYKYPYCGRYQNEVSDEAAPAPFEQAAMIVDELTFGRAAKETDPARVRRINFAQCAVLDALLADAAAPARVTSETTGKVSVSYADTSEATAQARYRAAASRYLAITGLMYRGCGE